MLANLGDRAGAIASYDKAIAINPNYSDAMLAQSYLADGRAFMVIG